MTNDMKGTRQIVRTAFARADAATVWKILTDSTLLPQWAPPVRRVDTEGAGGEAAGSVRRCRVELAGRSGTVVERCVGLERERYIAYVVDEDSLGLRRAFADYGFRISMNAQSPRGTRLTIETFYTPRSAVLGLMNALVVRARFAKVVDGLLAGLVRLAETRAAARPTGAVSDAATTARQREGSHDRVIV